MSSYYNFSSLSNDFSLTAEDPPIIDNNRRDYLSSSLTREELNDFLGINSSSHFSSTILKSFDEEEGSSPLPTPSSPKIFTSISSVDQAVLSDDPEAKEDLMEEEDRKAKIERLNQQLQQMSRQAESLSAVVNSFLLEVKDLEEHYKGWKKDFNEYGSFQGNILATLEYYNVNHDNLIEVLTTHFPAEKSRFIESLGTIDSTFKWTNCVAPLALNIVKFCVNAQFQKDLSALQDRYQELKLQLSSSQSESESTRVKNIDRIQACMDQFRYELEQDQQEALVKGQAKLDKLVSRTNKFCKHTFSIYRLVRKFFEVKEACQIQNKWIYHLQPRIVVNINCPQSFSQKQLYQEIGQFLKSVEQCKTIKEVQQKLKEVGIKEEVPPNFENWQALFKTQRFRRYLIQSYYYSVDKRPFMNAGHIERILDKHEADKARKIDQSFNFIDSQIEQCRNLDFDQITAHFKKLHIHFDRIQLPKDSNLKLTPIIQASEYVEYQEPPKTKDEWNQCIQDPEFCEALAKQWVDYQETTGQLAMQMMRQALLSKNQIERKCLFFRGVEYVVGIASSLIRLGLCLPQANLLLATSILELFVTDLAKLEIPGVGLVYIFHPLYPDMSFKIDSLVMILAEHFFAIKYKPNEYSLEAYKITLQARWFGFINIVHYYIALFKQTLLWMNMRLIENCIMRLEKKPLEEDSRYIQINEAFERHRLNCKKTIQELEESLNQLRLADVKLAIHDRSDAIDDLVDVLKEANFDYFSEEAHAMFEENIGLKLTEANKVFLKEKIEQFFCGSEDGFVKSYQNCHKNYLRV